MESLSILLKHGKEEGILIGIKVSRVIKFLHLIFVDDVFIMTKASMEEWKLIKNILENFCGASGLKINQVKSTFHFTGLEDWEMMSYKELFSFNFCEMGQGFKYMGYFLKAGKNSVEDWRWLLIKFEKRINHWCNG